MASTDASDGGRGGRLVLITGLSGSGKSSAAKCFEDLGYYLVDNLPLSLLERFLEDPQAHASGHDHIAVVTDVRAPGFAEDLPKLLDRFDRSLEVALVFFEASEEILVRRFSETRRPHPLALDGPLHEGIRAERELLADLRARADVVLDTSEDSIHDLRRRVYEKFGSNLEGAPELVISLISFGYKHGIPKGADLLFDVRFLPNPYFEPGLREATGKDASVREFLHRQEDFADLGERIEHFLLYVLPKYHQENRSYLTVAIGCTGGHHRSVAMVEALAGQLRSEGWVVQISHRDIER